VRADIFDSSIKISGAAAAMNDWSAGDPGLTQLDTPEEFMSQTDKESLVKRLAQDVATPCRQTSNSIPGLTGGDQDNWNIPGVFGTAQLPAAFDATFAGKVHIHEDELWMMFL